MLKINCKLYDECPESIGNICKVLAVSLRILPLLHLPKIFSEIMKTSIFIVEKKIHISQLTGSEIGNVHKVPEISCRHILHIMLVSLRILPSVKNCNIYCNYIQQN